MQTKLHHWAVADPGRRFDDLFNFVHDPATLNAARGRADRADRCRDPCSVQMLGQRERRVLAGFNRSLQHQLVEATVAAR
ncbi:hypothetical protein ACFVYE_45595 [Streptomyces sp. NPDC058239]|uniref:hypothetical protein n=1 Tax=Streptomyces sp. NPDC058239 TaxID=3346395 RepID=UPI0036EB2CAA